MKLGRPKELHEASFDLTPMIDVVLLLIIFFMLSSQFAQGQRTPMDLPQEPGRQAKPEGTSMIVIDVESADRYRLLDQSLSLSEVATAVAEQVGRAAAGAQPDLVVRAERATPAAALNRLAAALARVGVRSWKLETSGEGASATGGGGA